MKRFYNISIFMYVVLLIAAVVYSYALLDPNITLLNNNLWVSFREVMVQLGYYQRELSWYFYLIITIVLFLFYRYFLNHFNKLNAVKISFVIGFILLFSYPFLSHDFFNYIFDAKIFTYYHQSPYMHKALDYPSDEWIRFMHWTDRTYPYGPVFLVLSFVPSFLSFGKFLLNFLFFKAYFIAFYIAGVFFMNKLNKPSESEGKRLALIYAIHPFVILEGIVAAHNDIIGVSLAIIGIYYLEKKNQIISRLFFILSGGIKYITAPIIIAQKNNRVYMKIVFLLQLVLILYLCIYREIQPWYFLTFFAYLPFYKTIIEDIDIFLFGLLMSYYPFIRLGEWSKDRVELKHHIIWIFFALNIVYLLYKYRKEVLNVKSYRNILKV